MESKFLHDSSKLVLLRGRRARKSEVQLGRLFEEDGQNKQASANPCLYSSFEDGAFRWGDRWYYKDPRGGVMVLEPNAPFGYPLRPANFSALGDDEKVFLLKVEDRGPV